MRGGLRFDFERGGSSSYDKVPTHVLVPRPSREAKKENQEKKRVANDNGVKTSLKSSNGPQISAM